MRLFTFKLMIRLGLLAVFVFATAGGSGFAQNKRVFVKPEDLQKEEKDAPPSGDVLQRKRGLVVPPEQARPRVRIPELTQKATPPAFAETRMDLDIYRAAMTVDPADLRITADPPKSAEEQALRRAALSLPRVEKLLQMQKGDAERRKNKALQAVRTSAQPVSFSRKSEPEEAGKVIYKKPKKSIFPLKVFGER